MLSTDQGLKSLSSRLAEQGTCSGVLTLLGSGSREPGTHGPRAAVTSAPLRCCQGVISTPEGAAISGSVMLVRILQAVNSGRGV